MGSIRDKACNETAFSCCFGGRGGVGVKEREFSLSDITKLIETNQTESHWLCQVGL